ncbi:hypothetical protein [Brevibacterium renqingii]|uniref:hypothetical protein n=1 Tax=Brevibacterium renqingii TaxID=2776916 RepID=UPI001ADF8959|nr:hypothetical protein [Brevibacterium renqingii]
MTWVEDVANRAQVDARVADGVLRSYGITGPKPVPARRRLRVEALHFAGVKNLESPYYPGQRMFVPFSFTRTFAASVTALVSDGNNSKGKSSILEILAWGLRGSARELQPDVRSWLRQVCLFLTIADERVLVAWRVTGGRPRGSIIALPKGEDLDLDAWDLRAQEAMNAQAEASRDEDGPVFDLDAPVDELIAGLRARNAFSIASFDDERGMRQAVGDFMLNRLAIEELPQWNKRRQATTADDGSTVEHGWPLWSQAMLISKPSHNTTIGETPMQAGAVLGTFLATEWTSTRSRIRAHKTAVDGELAAIRRRVEADTKAREDGAQELRRERNDLQRQLDALPPEQVTTAEAAQLVRNASAAGAAVRTAHEEMLSAALAWGAAERARETAKFDLVALQEAAVTRRFWHSLKPSCCPRCDARVEQEQWERERAGSCSLCNSPIAVADEHDEHEPDLDSEEDVDPVDIAEERVRASELEVMTTSAAHDAAQADFHRAQTEFEQVNGALNALHDDPTVRRELERRIGVLDGRIQERTADVRAEDEEGLVVESRVLAAADKLADAALTSDRNAALAAASTRITQLGKELGMSNLESARLKGNAHLDVTRGGEETKFGRLDDGSRLRLKIAVVIALVEVGVATGLGRHPGFLVVDALAREELNEGDGEHLLAELYRVAETHDLQVITGTTHSALVDAVLPEEAVVRPLPTGFLW